MELLIIGAVIVGIGVVILVLLFAVRSMRPQVPRSPVAAVQSARASGAAVSASSAASSSAASAPSADAVDEIDRLLAQGQKIAAIKVLRERTGLGLAEAKRHIDAWPEAAASTPRPTAEHGTLPQDVAAQIDDLIARDQKILAIKIYRTSTGVGLKEAKNRIDAWSTGRSAD